MGKVKGSKQDRLVVVSYRPWTSFFRRLLALLLIVVSATAGYWYGRHRGFQIEDQAVAEVERLQEELQQKNVLLQESTLRVATLQKGAEVDQKATEGVRQVVKDLKDQIAALQEEVTLYKGIMAPSSTNSGLQIQEFTLDPTSDSQRYRFKLMLTQVGDNNRFIQGFVGVNVLGVLNGKVTSIPLKDLSDDVDRLDIRFRYRYFQDVKGELNLPDGFVPEQIQVVAQATGNKARRLERTFDWNALETNTNVGQ
jgi:hypothetical protein